MIKFKNMRINKKQTVSCPVIQGFSLQLQGALLAGTFLLLIFTGCAEKATESPGYNELGSQNINGEEESSMEHAKDPNTYTIPPIDQEVPVHLETATLALG